MTMKDYVVWLQDNEDMTETAVIVKNATSDSHAEEKLEKTGLLDSFENRFEILGVSAVLRVIE